MRVLTLVVALVCLPVSSANAAPEKPTAKPLASRAAPSTQVASDRASRTPKFLREAPTRVHLRSNTPYWRLGLAAGCGVASLTMRTSSERVGWVMLGGGLLSWALYDWIEVDKATLRPTLTVGPRYVGIVARY